MEPEMNGPVNGESPSNGPRLWEKSWTIDEMRKSANNWSLAGDAGLLHHLQDFSQQMISRVHEIGKEVDGLLHDTKMTGVRVHNVFNDFIMLANTQFVENRVYDEDVSSEETAKESNKEESQEKTREQREAELIPKVSEALQLGIKVTEDAFEALDSNVVNSDSEDDDDTNYRVDPILEAKDPYINRPLPYLIGTPNFMSNEDVGLEEESEEEEVGHGELSESEAEKDSSEFSSSEDESETEKPVSKPRTGTDMTESSESESSEGDLFEAKKEKDSDESDETEESDVEDEKVENEDSKDTKVGGFADELASKLGIAPPVVAEEHKEKQRSESESSHKKKKHKKEKDKEKAKPKKHTDDDDMFPTSIQEDEDDNLFAPKGGLFSTGKGLFDDDDEDEGGLFDDDVKKEEKPKKRADSSPKKQQKKEVESKKPVVKSGGGGGGLFDEEEDDDDFFPTGTESKKDVPEKKPASAKSDLFADDEDEDLFSSTKEKSEPEKKKKKTEKKLPAGAVSMFGSGPNPLAAAIKKQRKDSDEEDNDWSDGEKSRSSSVKSSSSSTTSTKQVDRLKKEGRSSSKNSLFDDDDADDALFSAPAKPRADSKSKAKPASSLFAEDDDNDLFASTKSTAGKAASQKKPVDSKARAGSLFDDDEEEDLFGVPAKPKESEKKKPVGGVSLFGGAEILKKKTENEVKEPEKKAEPVKSPPTKTTLSLFDDEEDDLFGEKPALPKETKVEKKTESQKKNKNLFEDDDLLFGEEEQQSPGVDIFGSPPKISEKKGSIVSNEEQSSPVTEENMATSPPKKKPVGGVSMFGGMDPMAALRNRKRSESSKEKEDSKSEVKVEKEKPKVKVEDKPEVEADDRPVPPSPPAAGDLFDEDEDDLFSVPKSGTKKDNIKSSLIPDDDDDDDMFSMPKPATKKPETKSSLIPDDEEDDMFSSTSITKKTSVKEPVSVDKNENSKDDEDDLFNLKPPALSVEPVKPKKPVGGVSMFGGMDPMSALKKKQEKVSPQKDSLFDDDNEDDLFAPKEKKVPAKQETKPDVLSAASKMDSKPVENKPEELPVPVKKKPPGAVSMFGGADLFGANKKKTEVQNEKDGDNTVMSSPDSDEMNLGINPAALLPGAAPPSEKLETEVIGFDKPAEVKTLQSANKDRAKIQTKRRPPSRHSRHFSPEPSFDTSPPPVIPENDRVPRPTSDLFGNEDMFSTSPPKPAAVQPKINEEDLRKTTPIKSKEDTQSAINDKSDDIFSLKSETKKGAESNDIFSKPKETKKNDLTSEEDIFSTKPKVPKSTNFDDDLFSAKTPVPKKTEKKEDILNDDQDIFASKKKTKNKQKTIFDDDNDIFASSSINDTATTPTPATEPPVTTATKSADDNIFEDSSLNPKSAIPKSTDTKTTDSSKNAIDENADDLFASKTTKKKTKKAQTKDEDLFQDDTDIFADVPAAKPKEKKKKKTTAATKKSIFKDDNDDIFAEASPTTKQKKEKPKKTTTTTEDIFDDPLA
ncbi:WASH complex subunit 2-like isoform X2 [Mytilus californianus]|uniref:WASH complex subunit 2-like isoform X2 n=1 Tax=Mytilus californianus TaxID=6549 RepID=UPI002247C144|nr:WASH complex subunit 2-like isoform X2 [Mytilus californianus]